MVNIKVDLTGQDPEDSLGGSYEKPKPGVYSAVVKECTPRYEDEDEEAVRDLEVVYEITSKKFKGSRVWDYVGFSEAAKWKLDQFMLAIGKATKKKRKFKFNPDDAVDTPVTLRIRASSYQGDYQPKVGQVIALDEDLEGDDEEVLDDEELEDDKEVEDEDDVEDEEDEDEEDEDEEDEEPWDEESLGELDLKELKEVAKEFDVEVKKGKRTATYIQEILEAQEPEEDEDEDEDEDEEEWTEEDVDALDKEEVMEWVDELEIKKVKGKKLTYYRNKLKEALVESDEDDDEDDDEVPF